MTNSQGIEGLPPGTKVVRVGKAKFGERYFDDNCRVDKATHDWEFESAVILAPDNAYGKWLDEVPVPEGWELDGTLEEAYRFAKENERYINPLNDSSFVTASLNHTEKRSLIIRRKLSPLDALLEEAASAIEKEVDGCVKCSECRNWANLAARLRAAKGGKL